MKIQGAVKKETGFITAGTLAACAVMVLVFYILHHFMPASVPFGMPVILGALCGGLVASLNFFLMAVTVQGITEMAGREAEEKAAEKAAAAETESTDAAESESAEEEGDPAISAESRDRAYRMMKLSFRNRMLMQLVWVVLAIVLPVFQFAAGIIPLFIPSLLIKLRGFLTGTQNP